MKNAEHLYRDHPQKREGLAGEITRVTNALKEAVSLASALERSLGAGLTSEFPKHLEHPARRVNLTAAYLLEYWTKKGAIPRYNGVIDGLRSGAESRPC